jgi:membrane-bound serine protease (ClpP class)
MKAFKGNLRFKYYLLLLVMWLPLYMAGDPPAKTKVFVMEIKAEIDPRMNRYVDLALKEADRIGADYVVIEMDTYGGAVTDAKDIVERLLEYEKPLWVFINKDAASAGALISIACDSIYMSPGASIGAATVVTGEGIAAPDKYQSYMRSTMRSTAEAKGRNPKIAEAMVDQNIEIEGITTSGSVITFTTSEAITHGFCEAQVSSIKEILERNKIENYELVRYQLSGTEKVIAFFLNPFISGLLILIIVGGIYFELQTPGVGFPLAAAAFAAILYFVPYYLNGLAANWEIIMFFVGGILLVLEIFVIPGFGVAGILGILFILSSLLLVMVNNDFFDFTFVPADEVFVAAAVTLTGVVGAIVLMIVMGVRFTRSAFFQRIALMGVMKHDDGYTSSFQVESMLGREGTTYTVLRPSGKILIDGEIYDAVTRGDYIEKGKKVVVIEEEGTSLKVRPVEEA